MRIPSNLPLRTALGTITFAVWVSALPLSPAQAQAMTAGKLAQICTDEAAISHADPRYAVGLCQLHMDEVLNALRQNADCAPRIHNQDAGSAAQDVLHLTIQNQPERKSDDAESLLTETLSEYFECKIQ